MEAVSRGFDFDTDDDQPIIRDELPQEPVIHQRGKEPRKIMKRLRFITVALAAALAISAVAVASASAALPEWRQKGEALKANVKFEATSETGTLETVSGKKLTCTADKAEGEIEATKAAVTVLSPTQAAKTQRELNAKV